MIIEPARELREMLRIALEDEDYNVQTAPDATTGLQVLRASAAPVIALFDVALLPHRSRERCG